MINIDIPHDHASFPGHFPENPILPGVLLLERVMSYVQSQLTSPLEKHTLYNVKFLSAVSPGDKLILKLTDGVSSEKNFTVYIYQGVGNEAVSACTGKLRFDEAPLK